MKSGLIVVAVMLAVAAGAFVLSNRSDLTPAPVNGAPMVAVIVPEMDANAAAGEGLFAANCAVCHGENAAGQDSVGPPLVHKIYEPSHHGDMAFILAARQGVRAHHWRFGDMPAVETVSDQEVQKIVAYIRALQRANGIN